LKWAAGADPGAGPGCGAFARKLFEPGESTVKAQCKRCRIEFSIPTDKIPEGRTPRILCPKCKEPTEISEKIVRSDDSHVLYLTEDPESESNLDPILDYANAIDAVDEGTKTALLCDTNVKRAEKIAQALQELDFWVVHALRAAFALGKLHHNQYDLIVLEENFNSAKESENLVLHHLQVLPMHLRRQFYLCLISAEKATLDATTAFRMGVNLILNAKDLEKAKVLFARAVKEYKSFYGLFNAELARKR
jgi:hypothetical protein